jgi:hypothetical protein
MIFPFSKPTMPFVLGPGEKLSLDLFTCPYCSHRFGIEHTVHGPKYCPHCGGGFRLLVPENTEANQ